MRKQFFFTFLTLRRLLNLSFHPKWCQEDPQWCIHVSQFKTFIQIFFATLIFICFKSSTMHNPQCCCDFCRFRSALLKLWNSSPAARVPSENLKVSLGKAWSSSITCSPVDPSNHLTDSSSSYAFQDFVARTWGVESLPRGGFGLREACFNGVVCSILLDET